MSFYNSLLKHFILPLGDLIAGGNYLKNIHVWRAYDLKSESELKAIQEKNLQDILDYAIANIPFYQHQKSNVLKDFPVLTKAILREHTQALVSTSYDISTLDKHHSSGSTGQQSFTYMTKDHTFYLRALQTHWWHWSGYNFGDNLLQFGISQKRSVLKSFKDFFFRTTYVKAFGLSEKELEAILLKVKKKKTLYIAGYPSVINQLAKVSLSTNIKPNVKGVICFGDKLFDHYYTTIKKAFGENISLIDTYGCAEGLLMACKNETDFYSMMSPHVYIEIVDDNGKPVDDGTIGNVLVTCLSNYAMPLIRYKLGDLAVKLPKEDYPKSMSLKYPLLKKVIGRETDIVKTTKGITLNVHSFTGVLEYYQAIEQYKIIQNDLKSIYIEYIVDNTYPFDIGVLQDIELKLQTLTKNCLEITFKEVETIKPTKSGKPQIIESNLSLSKTESPL
jgi:phenylacetate-CoA ligase